MMNLTKSQTYDPTPKIKKVLHEIGVRAKVREMKALEVFAGSGLGHVRDYIPMVDTLDAWENNPQTLEAFKSNIPVANAKLCDSYTTVKSILYSGKYDIVIIDNNLLQTDHFEHFDLFPDVFHLLKPHGYLILLACIDPTDYYESRKHVLPDPTPIIYARREFYDFDAWDNASSMKQKIERTYVKLAKECSKKVPWTYWEKRNSDHVYYLALEVKNGQ